MRFLWVDDIDKKHTKIQILQFTGVIFRVSSSPFLHNATVKHVEHYRQEDPEFVDKFLKCLFVDDLSSGTADQDGAYEMYTKSRLRLAKEVSLYKNS